MLDPHGGVGEESGAELRVVEFRGADESEVPFRDEVGEGETETGVLVADFHNETKMRFD